MNLNTVRATTTLGIAAIVAVALAGWFLLIGPATSEVSSTRTEVSDTQARNQTLSVQLAGLQAQAENLASVREAERQLDEWWPATADQPGFFETVSAAARASGYGGADLTTLSPSAPVAVETLGDPTLAPPTTSRFYVQTVVLNATGSFDQAQQLLRRLESLPRSVLITSIAVTASEETARELVIDVTGATFVAPPATRPGDEAPETTEAAGDAATEATDEASAAETETAPTDPTSAG